MTTAKVRVNKVPGLIFVIRNDVKGVVLIGSTIAECTNGSVCLHSPRDLSLCFNPNGWLSRIKNE